MDTKSRTRNDFDKTYIKKTTVMTKSRSKTNLKESKSRDLSPVAKNANILDAKQFLEMKKAHGGILNVALKKNAQMDRSFYKTPSKLINNNNYISNKIKNAREKSTDISYDKLNKSTDKDRSILILNLSERTSDKAIRKENSYKINDKLKEKDLSLSKISFNPTKSINENKNNFTESNLTPHHNRNRSDFNVKNEIPINETKKDIQQNKQKMNSNLYIKHEDINYSPLKSKISKEKLNVSKKYENYSNISSNNENNNNDSTFTKYKNMKHLLNKDRQLDISISENDRSIFQNKNVFNKSNNLTTKPNNNYFDYTFSKKSEVAKMVVLSPNNISELEKIQENIKKRKFNDNEVDDNSDRNIEKAEVLKDRLKSYMLGRDNSYLSNKCEIYDNFKPERETHDSSKCKMTNTNSSGTTLQDEYKNIKLENAEEAHLINIYILQSSKNLIRIQEKTPDIHNLHRTVTHCEEVDL